MWVLTTGFGCALDTPPSSVFASAIHAVGLMVERRLVLELAAAKLSGARSHRAGAVPDRRLADRLLASDELIDRALDVTRAWLDAGQPDDLSALGPHTHS